MQPDVCSPLSGTKQRNSHWSSLPSIYSNQTSGHQWLTLVCIYKTIFNPVNPELGTIPSRTNKIFKKRILNLSNPGQELNENKIHRANYFFINAF